MYDQVSQNKRRSILLIAGFVVLVAAVAWAVTQLLSFGAAGFGIALVIAAVTAFLSYWKSDSVALAMSRAKPADPTTYARLHNLVEGLCIASGLPKPRLYIVNDPAPNAFSTGRNPKHAAVAVTTMCTWSSSPRPASFPETVRLLPSRETVTVLLTKCGLPANAAWAPRARNALRTISQLAMARRIGIVSP